MADINDFPAKQSASTRMNDTSSAITEQSSAFRVMESVRANTTTSGRSEKPISCMAIEHVVDHIDTNRRNNRVENLRWITRLENILDNPITRKRIKLRCGSIEAFLANPSILQENELPPDLRWMRTVTNAEAK